MTAQESKRKLTAILSADVKGYSRLMSQDEEATVKTLKQHRVTISGLMSEHRGRVVDSPGDNILAEFGSVVDAVKCAVKIQEALKEKNAELPENRRMVFRIGVNLGDVIEEEDRIYGDGLNIAARLEGLAEGGGICISGTAFDQVKNKLPVGYQYLGKQPVKNIPDPVRAYKVLMDPDGVGKIIGEEESKRRTWGWKAAVAMAVFVLMAGGLAWNFYWRAPKIEPASKGKMVFELPDKPSIAVLPFVNMSEDPKHEFFADGMTEEIITALSKSPYLFVIARQSTFTYKGKPVKVKQVSEELGVRYVLEGSVRRSGEKVRITAQFIDAMTGYHLWAERFDRDLKDIFALQDEITFKIMKSVHEKLELAPTHRSGRGVRNVESFVKTMQGRELLFHENKEDNVLARKLFEEAIALDPNNAVAYTHLAWTYMADTLFGKSPKECLGRAIELAQRAIALDEIEAYAHASLGCFSAYAGQYEEAIVHAERGMALDPNSSGVLFNSGIALTLSGRPEEAIPMLHKSIRLNPFAPSIYFFTLSIAYRMINRFDEAIEQAKRAVERNPQDLYAHLALAAACALAGRETEAHAAAEEVLNIDPAFSVEQFGRTLRYKDKSFANRSIDAWRKAGLK